VPETVTREQEALPRQAALFCVFTMKKETGGCAGGLLSAKEVCDVSTRVDSKDDGSKRSPMLTLRRFFSASCILPRQLSTLAGHRLVGESFCKRRVTQPPACGAGTLDRPARRRGNKGTT
jgi:hypothetical protein